MKSYKKKPESKLESTSFPGSVQKSFEAQVGKVEKPSDIALGLYRKKTVKNRGLDDLEYAPSTEEKLDKFTKQELVTELIRMQSLIRNVAVELGIARKSTGSELRFYPDFVSRVITLIKVGWAMRL